MADASDARPGRSDKITFDTPHSARIWNYWMGGKDNYPVDRAAGDAFAATYPAISFQVKQSRQFLIRAVRFLAGECGVRQFMDVGTGLPTMENTHEVAQSVAPDSKIVYVDNDPLVLAHARALLTNTTPEGVTAYVDADIHDPDTVVADARNILNFNQPIAVLFMGILGHVADLEEARSIVSRIMAATVSGSYLVQWDSTNTSEARIQATANYNKTGAVPYNLRSPEQIARFYDGLDLLEPGVVSISRWRPAVDGVALADAYGAVARKP
ncbi:MAG: SAM-dependent methyltransferase [Pseudonocardia sp.]|nr:SAM-dependent methyltransferase [Pseudonocardia sp.]MBO0874008.1 SAM-dependent methyltransferase [Pseudonocardia sp.]